MIILRFYGSAFLRFCVGMGGRRLGKSSVIAGKIAVAEMTTVVNGEPFHTVPPGDVGWFGMISAEKGQAKDRVATTRKALLDLGYSLGVDNKEEVTIKGTNFGVKAITATKKGVVSFTSIGYLCDEMALWVDAEGENPASEVVESLAPTMITMKKSKGWYVSAPWAELGLFYEMHERGDDESQMTFHAPTWVGNPTITEAETHTLEKDPVAWARNYAAVPMKNDESKYFPGEFIDAAVANICVDTATRTTAGADLAFRKDTAAVVTLDMTQTQKYRLVREKAWKPGVKALKPSVTLNELVSFATADGADCVAADLHYIETLREHTDAFSLELLEYPSQDGELWYAQLKTLVADDLIDLSEASPELLAEMRACTSRPIDGGRFKIEVKRTSAGHGDRLSALVCGVWAMSQPQLEKKAHMGHRRYARESSSDAKHTDLPPSEWDT
jgi:hypothetical protein